MTIEYYIIGYMWIVGAVTILSMIYNLHPEMMAYNSGRLTLIILCLTWPILVPIVTGSTFIIGFIKGIRKGLKERS